MEKTNTTLDPTIVNLAKAVRQVESGGDPKIKGGSKEIGYYQYTPDTWNAQSKKYGVNVPLEKATPQQQNEVFYKWAKEKKDAGYNVGQISSMHNAGEGKPNAYKENWKGVNKFGVAYDTPAYAKRVAEEYQRLKTLETTTTPAPTIPEVDDGVKGGFVGRMLTGSTQKFGKTIGESLASGKNADLYSEAIKSHSDIQNNLMNAIREKKKLGGDTSRLENALKTHIESTPQLEDFTGDVINKTAGQVVGEGIGTGLEALSGGLFSSGKKVITSKVLSTFGKVKQGAGIGAIYGGIGGGSSAMQEGGGVGETLKGTAIGGATGAVVGGGLAYGGAKLGQYVTNRASNLAEKNIQKSNKITGEILQGTPDDIARANKVLKNTELPSVRTYEEGTKVLNDRIKDLAKKQDKTLSTNLGVRKIKDLSATLKVGEKTVKHNYVKDALQQLDDFYTKTNNQIGRAEIAQLRSKLLKQGLTLKEVNDIARLHGEKLNAFNASGELASGLTKQGAENTRSGLKNTVRELFGNDASRKIDREISDTIRVRDLFENMSIKVNQLKQRIQQRSLGAKAGYLVGKFINTLGLGSPKGIVEALIPRGQGFKVMNALDLEKALQKNLQLLQEINNKNIPESVLIQKLEAFFK